MQFSTKIWFVFYYLIILLFGLFANSNLWDTGCEDFDTGD